MGNEENKGFEKGGKGANPSTRATAPAPPAGFEPATCRFLRPFWGKALF